MTGRGRWLAALLILVGFGLACGYGQASPKQKTDVGTLERAFAAELQLRATHVPMMGMANGLARAFTHGGVRGLKVVTYETFPRDVDRAAIEQLARMHLSGGWSMMMHERGTAEGGESEMVWVQPAGDRVRLLVIDLEVGEMTLAQMELNPEQLVKWKEEHGSSVSWVR